MRPAECELLFGLWCRSREFAAAIARIRSRCSASRTLGQWAYDGDYPLKLLVAAPLIGNSPVSSAFNHLPLVHASFWDCPGQASLPP